MPLLRRQPFVPTPPPDDLQPKDEVFYCDLTKEIFRDFEAFFERTIMCNSLVWSCSLTGKSNLTYQEAVDSEKKAIKTVSDIPFALKQPILYIASLTCRGKVNEACDDVYYFMKDRYFVRESVEAILRSKWYQAKVVRVVPPTELELEQYKQEPDEEMSLQDKILMLEQYGPPPELFKYEVREQLDEDDPDEEEPPRPIHLVTVDCIRREKGLYSQAKVRLYLRYCMQFDENEGMWVVKKEAHNKFKLGSTKYSDIFTGTKPRFEEKRVTKKAAKSDTPKTPKTPKTPIASHKEVNGKSPQTKTTPSKRSQPDSTQKSKSNAKSPKLDADALAKEFIKIREERESLRQIADKRKQQKVDEKQLAKEKKKEEKRVLAETLKEWSKIRDDLECDDLKDLPQPIPVQCAIPNGIFGDFMMVLEFFLAFGEELQLKDAFPAGLTFELLERAVIENEVSGPLSDILQVLLSSLFEYQDAEAEEVKEAHISAPQPPTESTEASEGGGGLTYQGTPIKKLSMDSLTVSEILRLHLVSSGGKSSELRTRWRFQQRGGYCAADDPGVQLRQEDPHILHALAHSTVYELPIGDKMKIIKCLCHQIITYASIRDVLEEKASKLSHLRQELRALHANERRMRKEDAINRAKLRSEENGNVEDGPELEKLLQESAKRKADVLKKEQALKMQILKMQSMTHLTPLGQDRAFRRFWVFESLPGFFVEHDDDFVGTCLPQPTPCPVEVVNGGPIMDPSKSKEDIRNFFKTANKENDIKMVSPVSPEKQKVFGVCTSNPTSCPVHATYIPRTKWSFFEKPEDVEQLLLSLNERGYRESALKNVLLQEKDRVVEGIQKCAVHRLDNTKPEVVKVDSEIRKSTRQIRKEKEYDINLYFPAGTPVQQIMQNTLIDMILETEEKIFVGGLGVLKVKDRLAWRSSIEEDTFNPQVDTLTWGGKVETQTKTRVKVERNGADEEDNRSDASSPTEGENSNDATKKCVTDLACALLQLAQSVEMKYLKKPLGEDEKEKKRRLKAEEAVKKWEDHKEVDSVKTEPKAVRTPLERWELSLHSCTSLSQLYVHLALLDNSITWNRSVMNARCRLCRRKGDPEKMLLCDGCDRGHHMYCLKPLLTSIPDGDWFCAECKPREKPRTPRKARRVFSEQSEDEAEEEEEEEGEEEAEGEGEEGESEAESVHNEACPVCMEGGEVICCDTCPAVYHLECIPLRKVPRGKWSCPQCKTPPQEKERGKLRENNSTKISKTRQVLDFDDDVKEVVKHSTRGRTHTDPIRARSPPEVSLGKRRSAAEAVDKIANTSKRLRGDSNDDDSSSDNGKWIGSVHRKRSRPLPLPCTTSPSGVVDMGELVKLVADLSSHIDSWPFLKPVTRQEAPDYHRVIKHPMDLGTIKYKLNMVKYKSAEDFLSDLKLIFANCYTYNNEAADEYKCGQNLCRFAEQRLEKIGVNVTLMD